MTRERALELARQYWEAAHPAQDIKGVMADAILAAISEDAKEVDAIIRMQASVILQLRLQFAAAVRQRTY